VRVTAEDLTRVPEGHITEHGLRWNIDVGIQYLESWLRGSGCVPIYNLMEDAATAEICRAQIWQWVKFNAKLDDGRPVTETLVQEFLADQVEQSWRKIGAERFNQGKYRMAADLLESLVLDIDFPEFLTLGAYDCLE
jgi:malate synthase